MSFSPDGTLLASGSFDNTVKLWDVQTHTHIPTLEGHWGAVHSVSFSPDGTLLASGGGDSTVKLWDVQTHTHIPTLEGYWGTVHSVSFSPDGTLLASGSGDSTVKLWDVKNHTHIATLGGHRKFVSSVSFSPDGTILASGSWDDTVKLWDVKNHTHIATLEGHREAVTSVSFSPDGAILASGVRDDTVRLWDVKTHTNIAILEGHTSPVSSVSFSPDGTLLASGSYDNTVKLWDVAETKLPRPSKVVKISGDAQQGWFGVPLPKPLVVEVRDQYDNLFPDAPVIFTVTAGHGQLSGQTTIKNIKTDADGKASITFTLGQTPINTIDVFLVGRGFTGNSTVQFNINMPISSYYIATLKGHQWPVSSVSFSPDGTLLASGSNDDTVKLWDMSSFITSATPPETLKGDVNGDGTVDIQDLVLVASNYGQTGENVADVNGDGVVHIYDIILIAAELNTNAAAPALHPQDLSLLTPVDVKKWLSEAQQLELTDATSLRGILFIDSERDHTAPQLPESVQPRDVDTLSVSGGRFCHLDHLRQHGSSCPYT